MGKLASFAVGAGQGALATKRYQDSLDRAKKQDELLASVLTGGKDNMQKDGLREPTQADATVSLGDRLAGALRGPQLPELSEEEKARRAREYSAGMANGGLVQPMPQHWDKMSWQRMSFKK